MTEEEIRQIMESAATIAAAAAARAAVAAVEAVLGVEMQTAIEAAAAEAARIGAEVGAQASIKAVERERKKFRDARTDRRFRNTKFLLRNYKKLAANCSNAVFDAASDVTAEKDIEDILEKLDEMFDDEIRIESVMKSAARTQLMMDHIKRMLDTYEVICQRSPRAEEQRHYRVIEALYLTDPPASADTVAAREHIDRRTVYRDVDAACETLSVLIFGIDAIRKA